MLEIDPCVAYTVITKRADGKLMFLVERNRSDYLFPITSYQRSNTGLASVLEEIKQMSKLDIAHLELAELINMIIDKQRIPLFVFNYVDNDIDLNKLVNSNSELCWQVSDSFTDTLKKYEISGVPNFDQYINSEG